MGRCNGRRADVWFGLTMMTRRANECTPAKSTHTRSSCLPALIFPCHPETFVSQRARIPAAAHGLYVLDEQGHGGTLTVVRMAVDGLLSGRHRRPGGADISLYGSTGARPTCLALRRMFFARAAGEIWRAAPQQSYHYIQPLPPKRSAAPLV